jgi:hypothetical protein
MPDPLSGSPLPWNPPLPPVEQPVLERTRPASSPFIGAVKAATTGTFFYKVGALIGSAFVVPLLNRLFTVLATSPDVTDKLTELDQMVPTMVGGLFLGGVAWLGMFGRDVTYWIEQRLAQGHTPAEIATPLKTQLALVAGRLAP